MNDPKRKPSEADDPLKWWSDYLADMKRRDQAEAERIAKLTPAQREAEKAERARQAAETERRNLAAKIQRVATPHARDGSFTLKAFAYLLHGERPSPWSLIEIPPKEVADTLRILGTYIRGTREPAPGLPLYPENPQDPAEEWRFPRRDLMQLAIDLGEPGAIPLAKALGFKFTTPAVAPPPAPTALPASSAVPVPTSAHAAAPAAAPFDPAPKAAPTGLQRARAARKAKATEWKQETERFMRELHERAAKDPRTAFDPAQMPYAYIDLFPYWRRCTGERFPVELSTWQKHVRVCGFKGKDGIKSAESLREQRAQLAALLPLWRESPQDAAG